MGALRIVVVAGIATARAAVVFALALSFWAAAPALLGWQPTSVMTASMAPAIDVGDVVVARPADAGELLPGRVLLADDPDHDDRLRLHRLASVRDDGSLITRGDANPAPDSSPLHPDAVHGIGILRVPWVGLPVVWARTGDAAPLALTALLAGVCLFLATRRGSDDDATPEGGADPHDEPATRRGRRAAAVTLIAAAVAGLSTTPAWAAFSAETSASASIAAGSVTAPSALTCGYDDGTVVGWTHEGLPADGFELLVDDAVVLPDISGTERSARVPTDRYYSVFTRAAVTVRARVGTTWTAVSTESVTVGGALFGFGRPFCW